MSDDVRILEVSARPTVAVRHVLPMSGLDVGALFSSTMPRLGGSLEGGSAVPAGAPYARYYDFGGEQADIEIGIPVAAAAEGFPSLAADGEVGTSELPAGRVAQYVHRGSYEKLGDAYRALEQFIAAQPFAPAGAPWEEYVVMPDSGDVDPEQLVTQVSWPIT